MRRYMSALLPFALLCMAAPAAADPQLAAIPGARANMDLLPAEPFQSARFDYKHELTIALPASYAVQPKRRYPVLWVLDGPLMTRSVIGILDTLVIGNQAPEMIVIGIGSPASEGLSGVGRRIVEFSPPGNGYAPPGLGGERWNEVAPIPAFPHRADDFLAMLIDELRPALSTRFRFSGEHALYGHSAGGMLAAYAIFERPGAFQKAILGSPYLNGVDGAVFAREASYARSHDSLPVQLFIGAGDREIDEWFLAVSGIVSGTARFAETLHMRGYKGLKLTTRIYSGEDHYSDAPRVIGDGIRLLWSEDAAKLGSSWPTQPETSRSRR
jgi:predicted alpha/beta superfamily hydrolase